MSGGSNLLAGLIVLVVDDDPDVLQSIGEVLTDASANIMTATSAEEAISLLDREPPDVLVSDIGMPGCDGYHLLRMVRSRTQPGGKAIPAIALTGRTRTEDKTRSFLAGYQLHIAKPVTAPELVRAIRHVVDYQASPLEPTQG
jgi:CheY-like chemotaxis protein